MDSLCVQIVFQVSWGLCPWVSLPSSPESFDVPLNTRIVGPANNFSGLMHRFPALVKWNAYAWRPLFERGLPQWQGTVDSEFLG